MNAGPQYTYEGSGLLRFGEELQNYNASIADLIVRQLPAGARVLDFGAGFGTLTRVIAARAGNPDCVEPDERQRATLESGGFFCYATIDDVPSDSYDVIYSSNVLEHIADDVAALRDLRRVLHEKGKVVLYLPAFQSLYSAVDAAIGHHRRYDIRTITERLDGAGFIVRDAYYADVLGFIVSWIFKRLFNKVGSMSVTTMRVYDRIIFPTSRLIERIGRFPFGKNVVAIAIRKEQLQ